MQQQNLDHPLSALELQRLKSFIKGSPDAMSFHEATGFIAAICSAPTTFMPNTWLPIILGENIFESEKQAQEIYGLISRFYNQVCTALADGKHVLSCAALSDEELADWCAGFLEVSRMDETWANDELALTHLFPFYVLSNEFDLVGGDDDKGNIIEDDSEHRARFRKLLPQRVSEIHQYWLQWRRAQMPQSTSPTIPPKVNRNAPCPGGSGAKYKKCCGR